MSSDCKKSTCAYQGEDCKQSTKTKKKTPQGQVHAFGNVFVCLFVGWCFFLRVSVINCWVCSTNHRLENLAVEAMSGEKKKNSTSPST